MRTHTLSPHPPSWVQGLGECKLDMPAFTCSLNQLPSCGDNFSDCAHTGPDQTAIMDQENHTRYSHTWFTEIHPDVFLWKKRPLIIVDEGAKISSARTWTRFFLYTSHFQRTEPDSALNKIIQTKVPGDLFSTCSSVSIARCLYVLPTTCPVTVPDPGLQS